MALCAYFDFGMKTYAEDHGLTNHNWLVSACAYDAENIKIDYLEDSWKITVLRDYGGEGTTGGNSYALDFSDLVISRLDYEYDADENPTGNIDPSLTGIAIDWGTWSGYPYRTDYVNDETKWVGAHQYMQVRMKNNTTNNMIGFSWKVAGGDYYTTMMCSNLYLQGTIGEKTTTPSEEYYKGTYDIRVMQSLCSNRFGAWGSDGKNFKSNPDILCNAEFCATATYQEFIDMLNVEWTQYNNFLFGFGNVGKTGNGAVCGIALRLLGAADYGDNEDGSGNPNCDSRANIKAGTWVEVDYVIFGSTPDQLDAYKSYDEAKPIA